MFCLRKVRCKRNRISLTFSFCFFLRMLFCMKHSGYNNLFPEHFVVNYKREASNHGFMNVCEFNWKK